MARPRTRIGRCFGRLTVVDIVALSSKNSNHEYLCRCTCGNTKTVKWENLRMGSTKSCGCLQAEHLKAMAELKEKTQAAKNIRKKQLAEQRASDKLNNPPKTKHPLWSTWRGMIKRCYNKTNDNYRFYGGRGIAVCDRWRSNFWAFVSDMGGKPPGTTLDRIDPNGNYEPGNCRWSDKITQAENTRNVQSVYTATIWGVTKLVTDWAKGLGVSPDKIKAAIKAGMPPAAAVVAVKLRRSVWDLTGGACPKYYYETCDVLAKKFFQKGLL